MESIERDVIKNSEYVIECYKRYGKQITNLELQKLMYFLEAIYMVITGDESLYEESFSAWNFGPVNTEIYNRYKKFGRNPIALTEDIVINEANRFFVENLYSLFKDFKPAALVNLSHSEGSPWFEIYKENNGNIPRDAKISKLKTKNWFSSLVRVNNQDETE